MLRMTECCASLQGVTFYDFDFDTAATQIPVVRGYGGDIFISCYISVGTWEQFRVVRHAVVQQ